MEATPRAAADAAGGRARELAERRAELLAGVGSTPADVHAAIQSAERSAWRARVARARSALAHDRAAVAHDRAAAALEEQASRSGEPKSSILRNDANAHWRAARADRAAAEADRSHSIGEPRAEAT